MQFKKYKFEITKLILSTNNIIYKNVEKSFTIDGKKMAWPSRRKYIVKDENGLLQKLIFLSSPDVSFGWLGRQKSRQHFAVIGRLSLRPSVTVTERLSVRKKLVRDIFCGFLMEKDCKRQICRSFNFFIFLCYKNLWIALDHFFDSWRFILYVSPTAKSQVTYRWTWSSQ